MQGCSMFCLFGVIVLAIAVRSATTYDYFDSIAKSTAESIQNTPNKLNRLLSLEEYKPCAEVEKAHLQYKSAAAKVKGKTCAVDESRFDDSFPQLLKRCVASSASQENKEALTKEITEALAEVQLIDQSLKMNAKLFPSSDDSTSPGRVAKTKLQESLKAVVDKTNTFLQTCFHSTKSAMNTCITDESKKLWGQMIDATKSIQSC